MQSIASKIWLVSGSVEYKKVISWLFGRIINTMPIITVDRSLHYCPKPCGLGHNCPMPCGLGQ